MIFHLEHSSELDFSLKPTRLPALLIFMMVKHNDFTMNENEIILIFSLLDRLVREAPFRRSKTRVMKEVTSSSF